MELLDERWTMLVVRELVAGSEHVNDLRRGLPRMSPTLLSRRLVTLTRAGVVARQPDGRYVLTGAGRELAPIVESLGAWGVRCVGELGDADLDPKLLLWDMRRNVDHDAVPPGRTVVHFEFPDVAPRIRAWWLVLESRDADVCDVDPGHEVALTVRTSLRGMVQVWRGDLGWAAALRGGAIQLRGPAELSRALPTWFTLSPFAGVPRPVSSGDGGLHER
jgi:DNA-binding HxlR family transcriptional regulator